MIWNHRVVRNKDLDGEYYYGVHVAFYVESQKVPHSITEDPVPPTGETLEELRESIARYARALEHPVLELVDGKVVEAT